MLLIAFELAHNTLKPNISYEKHKALMHLCYLVKKSVQKFRIDIKSRSKLFHIAFEYR